MVTKILENKWHCFILILLAATASTGSLTACPPPPECDTPDRYVLWAKDNGAIFAHSEYGENVYLNYYAGAKTIQYCLVAQNNVGGIWYVWAEWGDYSSMDSPGCGSCTSKQCSFSYSGGTEQTRSYATITINYAQQPFSGYVRGTHTGWNCYKNGYGSYIIQGGSQITMNVYMIKVDAFNADVTSDRIDYKLEPSGVSGLVYIHLIGSGNPSLHTIVDGVGKSGGTYCQSFNIPQLVEGEFTDILVEWSFPSHCFADTHYYHIKVLGTCWITNYGLPDESQCSGSNQYFSYNNGGNCSTHSCTWLDAPGKSDWLNKVNINGSGKGCSGIFYSKDRVKSCCGGGSYPLDLRRIGTILGCPACSSYQLSNDLTIAKHQDKTGLYCGDQIYIHNEGIYILTDTGNQSSFPPGYDKDHWFDHFVGCIPCSFNVGSRSRMCIKIY